MSLNCNEYDKCLTCTDMTCEMYQLKHRTGVYDEFGYYEDDNDIIRNGLDRMVEDIISLSSIPRPKW